MRRCEGMPVIGTICRLTKDSMYKSRQRPMKARHRHESTVDAAILHRRLSVADPFCMWRMTHAATYQAGGAPLPPHTSKSFVTIIEHPCLGVLFQAP